VADRVKRPAFQWYPGDWRRDTALQSCSIAARGLWVEMLNLMHDGEPYGHLTAGGVQLTTQGLANLTGLAPAAAKKLLKELEDRKVFSRTSDGTIYSRRMVRDEDIRTKRANAGKLGGNPALVGPKDNGEVAPRLTKEDNPNPTPASASAFASAVAVDPSSSAHKTRLVAAANRGLSEHATRPQVIPVILVHQGSTLETLEDLAKSSVDIDFAERTIYELAKGHKSVDGVSGLKFFLRGTLKAWARRAAKGEAERSSVASSPRHHSVEDRARIILALGAQYGLFQYFGAKAQYEQSLADAAADPRAFPGFADVVRAVKLSDGIGNQPEHFAMKELVRRLESTNGVGASA
jgi:hypothetical protein